MPKTKKCEVVVGNIGSVVKNVSLTEAKNVFKEYVRDSKMNYGRSGNEEVSLFCDGELIEDYVPEDMNEDEE